MSSFQYMGLKDLFLLTKKKKKDAKLHFHKHYNHKQSNDRHKEVQVGIIRASRGLWLFSIAFPMTWRALTSHCLIFADWSVKTRQLPPSVGRMYKGEEKKWKKWKKETLSLFFLFFSPSYKNFTPFGHRKVIQETRRVFKTEIVSIHQRRQKRRP